MKNNNKTSFVKRVIAYIFDFLIISIISSLLLYLLPKDRYNKYADDSNKLSAILSNVYNKNNNTYTSDVYTNSEVSENKTTNDYIKEFNELSYDMEKEILDINIVTIGISLLYYVVFAYYMNGQTIGKKVMKIKVTSANGKKIGLNNFLLRSIVVDQLLMKTVLIVMLMTLSKTNYISYSEDVSNVFSVILVLCFAFMLYRQDGRGLHDLISNTVVVDIKTGVPELNPEKEEVKEADYEERPATIQIKDDSKEEKEKEEKKESKKKTKRKIEDGVSENERV